MDNGIFERFVYCPFLKRDIDDAYCYEIVHCGRGEFLKKACPEIVDWDKAIMFCKKCRKN